MLSINANVHEMGQRLASCDDRSSPAISEGLGSSCASSPTSSTFGDSLQTSSPSSPVHHTQHSTPFPAHQQLSKAIEVPHAFKPYNQTVQQYHHVPCQYTELISHHNEMPSPYNQHQAALAYHQSQMFQQQMNFSRYTSNTSFDDSNYYSRNQSFQVSPNKSQQRPKLSFSIEAILSKVDKKPVEHLPVHPWIATSNQSPISRLPVCQQEDDEESTENINAKSKRKRRDSNSESASSKRIRTIFTQEQLDKLEVEFMRQQYMVGSERTYLANSLNLSEAQVKIWFQNRRIKWRKTQETGGDGAGRSDSFNSSSVHDD